MKAIDVYIQMDGLLTKRYYTELTRRGSAGVVAMNLFRAQKCSSRAKVYRRRAFTEEAYARKEWSMGQLCDCLRTHGKSLGIDYGWREDPDVLFGANASYVLYVEIPPGQVSFHCPRRGNGPTYMKNWDRKQSSQERIVAFCDMVYNREFPTNLEAFDGDNVHDHGTTTHEEKLWPDGSGRK